MYIIVDLQMLQLPVEHCDVCACAPWVLGVVCGWRRRDSYVEASAASGKMNSLEEKMKVVEGYCEVVLASEQEKLPEIERLKQQMDSFEEDRGREEGVQLIAPVLIAVLVPCRDYD